MRRGFLVVLLLIPLCVSSQVTIGFQTGFHFSNMTDLHNLNLVMPKQIPFDTQIVSDFPGYWYYKPYIKLGNNKTSLGISTFYTSTGSRISGQDYSGDYRFDIKVHTIAPAIFADVLLHSANNIQVGFKGNLGMLLTDCNLSENLTVNDRRLIHDDYDYRSYGLFIQPDIRVAYSWKSFCFDFNAGYLVPFGTEPFHLKDNREAILINPETDDPVNPGWNGLQAGFSISYSL